MNAHDIKKQLDLIALAEQAGAHFRKAGKGFSSTCPIHHGDNPTAFHVYIGDDGFQHFRCFTRSECNRNGSDVIAFMMTLNNWDFKQALEQMGGKAYAPAPRPAQPIPTPPAIVLPGATWQVQRWQEITQATLSLEYDQPAQIARDYLHTRSLEYATWLVYQFGFGLVYNRPAIVIPWWDSAKTITAVKYRFIDDLAKRDPGRRFGMAEGSKPILFGLHLAGGQDTLLLCEGEFNAASITQVASDTIPGLDALSFGSQSGGRADILRHVANDYQRVIVWADEPEKANEIRLSLARPAEALCSPQIDGTKYDANALLKNGYLADFLRETIQTPTNAQ